jgi:ketol-acid reductoisomerase
MMQRKTKKITVAILGYGSQGRAIALNLRDSSYEIIVGLKSRSASRKTAKTDKFKQIFTTSKAVQQSDIVIFALPDHLQGRIFEKEIKSNLRPESTLIFLHGFSIHFGFVKPPNDCNIILIAPHAPGVAVREKYLKDKSISAFGAVHQDYTKNSKKILFDAAKAIGFKKSNLIMTSFADEAIGDLFGEQAVLCGGLSELIMGGFNTLVKSGLPPENAYLEVAYQLDLIIDLIKKHGIKGMYDRISIAAKFGSAYAGKKIIDKSVVKRMESLYKEIESGKFARKINKLDKNGIKSLKQKISKISNPEFEKAAKKYSR